MAEHKVLVSVVVPVYNGERYIKDTIDSLLAQTLGEIEILVIDDGSTDNTRNLLDAYNDSRLRVVTQPNRGTFAARMRGFQEARGAYVGYVDGDDLAKPTMFEKLYHATQLESVDIVSCAIITNRGVVHGRGWHPVPPATLKGVEPCVALLDDTLWGYCWNKLYKRTLYTGKVQTFVEGLQEPLVMAEDFLQNLLLFSEATSFAHIEDPLYVYRIHSNSIMRRTDRATLTRRINQFTRITRLCHTYVAGLEEQQQEAYATALAQRDWVFAKGAVECVHLMGPIGRWSNPTYTQVMGYFPQCKEQFNRLQEQSGLGYQCKWWVKRNFPWAISWLQRLRSGLQKG